MSNTSSQTPPCDPELPQTCQVGDLSGKYGKITSDPFYAAYPDDFASTLEGIGSFFGNRSLTIHFGNKTRITCANFTLAGSFVGGSTTANATFPAVPAEFTGAASKSVVPMLSLLAITVVAWTI